MLLVCACGGDDKKQPEDVAKNLTDPRRVPTATVPAEAPPLLGALDAGQPQRPVTLPETYIVKAGDTLGAISTELGVSVDELTKANPNLDPRTLRIGQELRVPRPTAAPQPTSAVRGPATSTATARPGATATGTSPAGSPAGTATRTAGTATRTATAAAAATRTAVPGAATVTPGPATAGGRTYTVQAGDTGCQIAKALGVPLAALAQVNNTTIAGLASLRIGQTLQVPSTGGPAGC